MIASINIDEAEAADKTHNDDASSYTYWYLIRGKDCEELLLHVSH